MANTPQFIEAVVEAWRDGHSSSEIGRELGVTRNAVIGILQRYQNKYGRVDRKPGRTGGCTEAVTIRNIAGRNKQTATPTRKKRGKHEQTVVKHNRVDKYISVNKQSTNKKTTTEWGSKEAMRKEIEEAMVRTAGMTIKV